MYCDRFVSVSTVGNFFARILFFGQSNFAELNTLSCTIVFAN